MAILSKANLVDEGIDLDEIKNLIRRDPIVVGENNGIGFSKLLEDLQGRHDEIQKVLLIFSPIRHHYIFHSSIQPPSPTFVNPSLTN